MNKKKQNTTGFFSVEIYTFKLHFLALSQVLLLEGNTNKYTAIQGKLSKTDNNGI